MKFYFALSYSPFSELTKCKEWGINKILSTYYVLRKTKVIRVKNCFEKQKGIEYFLDSGAFSAFTKREKIDVKQYIDFIKETKSLWTVYAGLDVIGDYRKTAKNLETMEQAGLQPLPTFHFRSPLSELERICKEYDYFCLGGLVPLSLKRKQMEIWLDKCWSVIKRYWPKKVHAFGVNSSWIWKKYPFYSVDATSWNQGMKFGRVCFVDGITLKGQTKKNPALFVKSKMGTWQVRTQDNINAFLLMEKNITRLWEARGIDWEKQICAERV